MKIWLSPQLSIAFLPVPFTLSYDYGFSLLWFASSAWNIPCAEGMVSAPCVQRGTKYRAIMLSTQQSGWVGRHIAASFSGVLPVGKGVPPQASLQTRAPAQEEVAAHQYAEVVASRQ